MKVTLFDYGAGNLHSLAKALAKFNVQIQIEPDPLRAVETDVLVLPGVGAFGPAATRLAPGKEAIRQALLKGLPCLGICLGMQLLFDSSEEGEGEGLGIFKGRVTQLKSRRIPHIGWNTLEPASALETVYYAHSFVCRSEEPNATVAWTTHERDRFSAMVRKQNTVGVQFHPEKSSTAGIGFLGQFLNEVRR